MITLSEERVGRLLVGKTVLISVGEPWDFESPDGENTLRGRICTVRSSEEPGGAAGSPGGSPAGEEIELEVTPFFAKGAEVARLFARARYSDHKGIIERLASGLDAEVNLHYDVPGGAGHRIGGFGLDD